MPDTPIAYPLRGKNNPLNQNSTIPYPLHGIHLRQFNDSSFICVMKFTVGNSALFKEARHYIIHPTYMDNSRKSGVQK